MKLVVLLLGIALMGCETKAEPTTVGPWKKLGEVSNGAGTGTVFWTVNVETGDRVYVLVGGHVGGVYVVPGKPSAEAITK